MGALKQPIQENTFEGAGWQSCTGCAQQQAEATAASIKVRFM
jgi:hypothetical protein